jgi:predicted transcriptional regulator
MLAQSGTSLSRDDFAFRCDSDLLASDGLAPHPVASLVALAVARMRRDEALCKEPATCWVVALEARYNHGDTESMKTAISIPDSLFQEAERLAKTRGWSRSELYANAVTAYVNSERFAGVREKLDSVYGHNEEDSAIDPLLADAQARSLPGEKW